MNPCKFLPVWSAFVTACCLLLSPAVFSEDTTFEDGPVGFDRGMQLEKTPWQEGSIDLPAWPGKLSQLIELNVSTAGLPYRVYLDPASLVTGSDRVVRYTSVLVSSSGVWNVTYEGLHCGERKYRRFAYGDNGQWQVIANSTWEPVTVRGVGQYRKVLYDVYFCDVGNRYLETGELVRRLRHTNDPAITEE